MLVHSIGGHIYYITFINDFSRMTCIYYFKHKDEAFKIFKDFKSWVENQTRNKIKIFKSDISGEYISNEFIKFCNKEGIKKDKILPYNTKQNEVVERKNRFIVEFSHAMLHDKHLSKFISGEVMNVSIYIQNRVPHY